MSYLKVVPGMGRYRSVKKASPADADDKSPRVGNNADPWKGARDQDHDKPITSPRYTVGEPVPGRAVTILGNDRDQDEMSLAYRRH